MKHVILWLRNLKAEYNRLLAEYKHQRNVNMFSDGYNWAMNELERGASIKEIEDMCDSPWDGRTHFDFGAEEAINDWIELERNKNA